MAIFAAESGYLLSQSQPGATLIRFVPMGGMAAAVSCLIAYSVNRWYMRRSPRPFASRLALFAAKLLVVLSLAWQYDYQYGIAVPTRMDWLLGQRISAVGTIVSATPYQRSILVDLKFSRVQGDSGVHRCQLLVTWWLRASQAGQAGVVAGDLVNVEGVLVTPAARTASGKPLRARLAKLGIYYEFEGRITGWSRQQGDYIREIHRQIDDGIQKMRLGDATENALLNSIVFGGQTLTPSIKQAFLQAGLLHVLAASGANVLLLKDASQRLLFPLLRRLHVSYAAWAIYVLCMIWLFTALCGYTPSVLRAAWMASYGELGAAIGKRLNLTNGLLFAGLMMAFTEPQNLWSQSSALSFAATFAIGRALSIRTLRLPYKKKPRKLWRGLQKALSIFKVTLVVELYLVPLTLLFFQQITPFSIVSNLIAEPLLAVLLPISACYMVLAVAVAKCPYLYGLGWITGHAAFWLLGLLERLVSYVAALPGSLITLAHPSMQWALFYYPALFVLPYVNRVMRRLHHKNLAPQFVKK